jgi:hypothetical protein
MTIGRIDAFVNEICPLVIPIKCKEKGLSYETANGFMGLSGACSRNACGPDAALWDGAEWERRGREGGGG